MEGQGQDMDEQAVVEGWPVDEIDSVGVALFEMIADLNIPIILGVLGLCRAITMIGSPEDLDMACKAIDKLAEIPYQESMFDVDVDPEDEDGV